MGSAMGGLPSGGIRSACEGVIVFAGSALESLAEKGWSVARIARTMDWLSHLQQAQPIAHAVLVLAGVVVVGLALGSQKIRGIGLGVAGVLFAGLLAGALRVQVSPEILGFVREFGLILFVYTIGMQVGPGFLTSLRRQGLPLNSLALLVVLLGAGVTLLLARILHLDMAAAVGLFAGATTNTPALSWAR